MTTFWHSIGILYAAAALLAVLAVTCCALFGGRADSKARRHADRAARIDRRDAFHDVFPDDEPVRQQDVAAVREAYAQWSRGGTR